jgi:hypothetical protein
MAEVGKIRLRSRDGIYPIPSPEKWPKSETSDFGERNATDQIIVDAAGACCAIR